MMPTAKIIFKAVLSTVAILSVPKLYKMGYGVLLLSILAVARKFNKEFLCLESQ